MQVGPYFRRAVGGGKVYLDYWCEGCNHLHGVTIEGPGAWSFDGNYDNPTFEPSQLATSVRYKRNPDGSMNWAEAELGPDGEPLQEVCHTFIRGGMVLFLSDSTHALAGQTRPMVPLPDWARDES